MHSSSVWESILMFKKKPKPGTGLTLVGSGSKIQGNLNHEGNLRVDGAVLGSISVTGDIEVASSGSIEGAEVQARNAIVHGTVKAVIVVQGKLTLSPTARIEGDVITNALDMAAGATFHGHITTRDPKEVKAVPPPARAASVPNAG
jgi:cytoskeletal protein CcmA (bactofilin family)